MKFAMRLIISLSLYSTSLYASASTEHWQDWISQLPSFIEERGASSSNYMKNYLQCMDDQQALKSQPDMTIGNIIDNALDSGNECAHLLNEMLESLTDEPIDSLNEKQKEKLLRDSF